jgi:hypothetical protein
VKNVEVCDGAAWGIVLSPAHLRRNLQLTSSCTPIGIHFDRFQSGARLMRGIKQNRIEGERIYSR